MALPPLDADAWPEHGEEAETMDSTYADDSKFFGQPGGAEQVVDNAREFGNIVVQVYADFALQLPRPARPSSC